LIRDILLDLASDPLRSPQRKVFLEGVNPKKINDHLVLLHDHRLIECLIVRDGKGGVTDVFVKNISAGGREFLKGAKCKESWKGIPAQGDADDFSSLIATMSASAQAMDDEAGAGDEAARTLVVAGRISRSSR
jgi:hypothetical protein